MTPAIRLSGVAKAYRRRGDRGSTSLKSLLVRDLWRRHRVATEVTWSLRAVDLEIAKGATVAIIGRNGSGKSTLLNLIGGLLKPTTGTVEVDGRTCALIEIGAGFHTELSGRENVVFNGLILGFTRAQIRERFDEIVRFAELEACIDEPLRTYSTGMYMRLGFSVAVHLDPDIFLIDEVLSVGDLPFVHKCLERMDRLKKAGKTIVLVTHDLDTARLWCSQAVWIDEGRVRMMGDPHSVVETYRSTMS